MDIPHATSPSVASAENTAVQYTQEELLKWQLDLEERTANLNRKEADLQLWQRQLEKATLRNIIYRMTLNEWYYDIVVILRDAEICLKEMFRL